MILRHDMERMDDKKIIPLPMAAVAFILQNLQGFNIWLEDGERIVLKPAVGAVNQFALQMAQLTEAPAPTPSKQGRPKFTYRVENRAQTPDLVRFGLTKPRYQIYKLVYEAGEAGIGYAAISKKTSQPHGSIMQVLHWLQKQKLITGKPE